MGVNSLPKTVTRQRRGCDLNPGPAAPESSTLTTRPTRASKSVICLYVGRRQAVAEPLRSHGLSFDEIDVYLASSSTPLPLASDCFRLAGSFLYVRGI